MQTIYLDISNRGVIPVIYAKQNDVGRKVEVVLTNSGLPYEPEAGSAFSAWYSGASGMGNYTDIGGKSAFAVSGNKVTVELITQMLQNPGEGFLCLVLSRANGDQIGLWNIPYICEAVPGAGSEPAKDYYTAFSQAVAGLAYPDASLSVAGKAADAAAVGEKLNAVSNDIDFQKARIDNLSTLEEGSTSGDAELQDIRTGYNQILYPNAGEAVRGQASQLSKFAQAAMNIGTEMLDLSKATFISGSYINKSGEIIVNNSLQYAEDYFQIQPDWESLTMYQKIYEYKTGTETTYSPKAVFYTASGAAGTPIASDVVEDEDFVTYKIPYWAASVRFNFGATSPVKFVRVNKFKNGKVAEYTGTFTELKQILNTGIRVHAGKKYLVCNENNTGWVNVYCSGNTSNALQLNRDEPDGYFTPTRTNQLNLFNYEAGGYLGEVKISVYLAEYKTKLAEQPPKIYTVGQNASRYDYTSFTQCLLDLKDDASPKIIYINEGDYDIYEEYKACNVPVYTGDSPTYDYVDYCVWIPKNTHIIGRGIVRLMWMPDPNEVELTYNESATVSPVNCAGTMTLENVEIHCKNGRYCIHDDPLGNSDFTNAIKKYNNVRCYKYANDPSYGFNSTIGFGVDRTMRYEFHNCLFKNEGTGAAFYMHDRKVAGGVTLTEQMGSNVVATNCVIDAAGTTSVKFGNSTSAAHIRVDFNSCWFSGKISCINESSSPTTYPNSWDLKLLLCNDVQINIADTANKYPAKVYAY